jgi:MFS family permease
VSSTPVSRRRGPRSRVAAFGSGMFSSLSRRNYRLWFFGQTVSQSGTWMQSVAQAAFVHYYLHAGAVALGITVALQFGPVLVLGPVGGLLADRFDKRKLMLATQTAFTVQALALGVLVASGFAQLWMVWVLAGVMGVINAFDNPARQSFVVEMVGPSDLFNAVGLNSVIVNVSRIAGPALAGVLMATVGISWTFLLNALSFAAVIAALAAMRPQDLHRRPPVPREKGQIRAGLRYASGSWQLWVPLVMMAIIGTLAYNFSVILPLMSDLFHGGKTGYTLLAVAQGAGALAGGLGAASWHRPGYRMLVLVTLAFGVFLALVAAAPSMVLLFALLIPMGAASVLFITTGNSLLQLHASDAMRGRVMALWAMVFLGSTPIGGPLTGLVAAHGGVRAALVMGAVATLLTAAGTAWMLRRIRAREAVLALGGHEPGDAPAPSERAPRLPAEAPGEA